MKKSSKLNRSYSVIVVSDATAQSRTFSISSRTIHRILGLSVIFVIGFGFLLFHYLTISLDKQKMRSLIRDHKTDQIKVAELTHTVEELQKTLTDNQLKMEKILVTTGLTSPQALIEVGSGGPPSEDAALAQGENGGMIPSAQSFVPQKPVEINPKQTLEQAREINRTLNTVLSALDQQKLIIACTPMISPTHGHISSAFGWRIHPMLRERDFHPALDISTQLGNPIVAPADGIVLQAEAMGNMGRMITIDHSPSGYVTRYGHLSKFAVKEGQRVKRRQVIGYVGSTGMSTAPHLHYEVHFMGKAVNPFYYILDMKTLSRGR